MKIPAVIMSNGKASFRETNIHIIPPDHEPSFNHFSNCAIETNNQNFEPSGDIVEAEDLLEYDFASIFAELQQEVSPNNNTTFSSTQDVPRCAINRLYMKLYQINIHVIYFFINLGKWVFL